MDAAIERRESWLNRVFGRRPGIFFVCLFAWTLTNLDQSLFGYAIPGILAEFQLPLEAAGTILTISFVFAALLIVCAGVAADRWGRGPVLTVLLASSAVFVGLQGFAATVVMLTLFRALGFGLSGGLSPITNALVVENAADRYRGVAMGLLQCGYPLGWLLASLLAAPLLARYDWRVACFVGFIVVPLAIPIGFYLARSRDGDATRVRLDAAARSSIDPHGAAGRDPGTAPDTGAGRIRRLFDAEYRGRSLASMLLFFAFGGAYAGSAFFFPTFFAQERGYTPADASLLVGLSNGIAVIGYVGAALLGEFVWPRRSVFVIWVVGGALALLGLLWASSGRSADLLWFAVMATMFYGSQAVVPVLIAELYPTQVRASALAICASAPLSIGFAVFPMVVPQVVARAGWQLGLSYVVVPLLVIAAVAALCLPNRRSGLPVD
ncbi:MAG: MFS transporter [Sinobacteraceae bacterium]|nr:MFS transporter [Nevskiaceae bacterium]MCP5339250.1 MFS transporter [Nevskiaceae bacterium]MCP5359401.1 MFS transporter [Nevskiaceae bacterium]MCP5467328.1 MFS transporter [Nevskiaceae bacterium]MCP5470840.1 MFS transporter [Nevskiaceae bacterium]